MKKFIHATLVLIACIPWIIAVNCAALCLVLVLLADKVWPNANWGNCWSYVGPKWFKYGGYLTIRYADDVRLFGILRIPHAIWIKTLGTAETETGQAVPINRSKSKGIPWRVFYFPFIVKSKERAHNAILP